MADQNLTVNLDANAEPLLDALANIDQNAQSASKSLENIEAAGELAVEGIEKVTDGVTAANGKLDNLNATASDAADKLAEKKLPAIHWTNGSYRLEPEVGIEPTTA